MFATPGIMTTSTHRHSFEKTTKLSITSAILEWNFKYYQNLYYQKVQRGSSNLPLQGLFSGYYVILTLYELSKWVIDVIMKWQKNRNL